MNLILRRVCYRSDCTFAVLIHNNQPIMVALEDPFRDNKRNESCIVPGTYKCRRYSSAKYPNTWEITDVPQRDKILFHAGNTAKDTEGCVLLGEKFGEINGVPAIQSSRAAFEKFMLLTKDIDDLTITVEHGGWGR